MHDRVVPYTFGQIFRTVCLWMAMFTFLALLAACERRPAADTETQSSGLLNTAMASTPEQVPATPTKGSTPSPATELQAVRSSPTPRPFPTATPYPEFYTVKAGDTLSSIAERFHCTVEELLELNGLASPNVIYAGQTLELPRRTVTTEAPSLHLLPDSEVVYGPTYKNFNVIAEVQERGGYLATYTERVEGEVRSGSQIVDLVTKRFSVGPRVLLALLEFQSGWLTEETPDELAFPFGLRDAGRSGLFLQASWAANRLNQGYYGQLVGREPVMRFEDGTMWRYTADTNPGSAAIANVLAQNADPEKWELLISPGGFLAVYNELYGNPWDRDVPVVPPNLTQPTMKLPWRVGDTWHFTGGPHGGWGDFSAWAALDFIPPDVHSCWPSVDWVRAVAPGLVVRSENGEVVVDLDGDGFAGTGWTVFYMHIHSEDRVRVGDYVQTGDALGHPSCEGGFSEASHLHIARRYNGQWMEADGPVPFVLSGWEARSSPEVYDGWLVRGDEERRACECRREINEITAR